MKLFFANSSYSELADKKSQFLFNTREALLSIDTVYEAKEPGLADAIIIQEINSYKDFRYIKKLLNDPLISKYPHKVFTINHDDCATGLLKGLYTSIPKSRYNPAIHASVPYMGYPNELIFATNQAKVEPLYLAGWRGNTESNKIRTKMFNLFYLNPHFQIATTDSWLNHKLDEKKIYINIIRNAKFSLCPAGWSAASFRIYETTALGRCPVIIADNFMPPKGPNWKEFALFFLIVSAPKCSNEMEIKRWTSLSIFWSNKWTIPQRVVNKVKKMANQ
jgi:hypothetical protein